MRSLRFRAFLLVLIPILPFLVWEVFDAVAARQRAAANALAEVARVTRLAVVQYEDIVADAKGFLALLSRLPAAHAPDAATCAP